ncbi:phage tail tape measure protein [Polaromonas naphthalenivorans]|uniref:Phage tail tape measure protein, TP901 family n=1 Tax=Polaromonas naphthalenivorans (strain CJ2) TaxID=365044 RepID=A1VSI3_POLNA|nr:phage tail tape measure protein [Polaromonas naphthalenivorans]ABM38611.1 phage tail tape measure protein, TP901 family [Polaromonas naphthalenivorans CJ2]
MSNNLRLQVILQTIDKASAVLKKIRGGSNDASQALKATRDKLKELNAAQKSVSDFRELRTGLSTTSQQLKAAQAHVKQLAGALSASGPPTAAMVRQFEEAKRTAGNLGAQFHRQSQQVNALREQLKTAGISTSNLGTHERQLRADIEATNKSLEAQKQKLKAVADHQRKLSALKASHARAMMQTGILAAGGVGAMAAGRGMARPVGAVLGAYGQQEDATSQLRGSMMRSDGSVSAEFKAINELAQRLGDRLPGTTADFINMMTMLQRQGLSAKSVLGGTGEAAAYLGVQLRMPVTAAAEFAAKMQDATRTTEGDMMALMDTIQRTFYLGVDSGNMLQGFTKMGPALGIIHQEGLKAANTLAPLLVMMDQAGMAGEASGNAIRKVFQATLNEKKLGKANKLLGSEGFQLKFVNGKGQFAGLEQLYSQLAKLKGITSDVKRTTVIHELFGDDAETMQVLNTLMDKGLDGYKEVTLKMQAQADLRQRVEQQLKTLNNVKEAAMGTFTNVLAALGETVAPDAKALIDWLSEVAGKTREWIAAHPVLVGWLVKAVAVVAALTFVLGAIALTVASVLGPFLLLRFAMGMIGLQGGVLALALRGLGPAIVFIQIVLRTLFSILAKNPFVMLALGIAGFAASIIANWDGIKAAFTIGDWGSIGHFIWQGLLAGLNAATLGMSGLLTSLFGGMISIVKFIFGIQSPSTVFAEMGLMLMMGLVNGITSGLSSVQAAISGAASSAIGWFKEKLGIHSPSLVFMQAGANVSAGAALGITSGYARVRQAAAGLSLAAAGALPLASGAEPLRIDTRPPLGSTAAAPLQSGGGGNTYITINAAPGMDAQALARAVGIELDKRDRQKRAAGRSSLSDLN